MNLTLNSYIRNLLIIYAETLNQNTPLVVVVIFATGFCLGLTVNKYAFISKLAAVEEKFAKQSENLTLNLREQQAVLTENIKQLEGYYNNSQEMMQKIIIENSDLQSQIDMFSYGTFVIMFITFLLLNIITYLLARRKL
jgi:hypothetical protein